MQDQYYNIIPKCLQSKRIFVAYKLIEKKDQNGNTVLRENNTPKYLKIPYNSYIGIPAKPNNPNTYSYFSTSLKAVKSGAYDGIGIMLGNDLCGIDLDNVLLSSSKNRDLVDKIVSDFNSYTEYSPSKVGIHILFFVRKQTKLNSLRVDKNGDSFEFYNKLRFFTLTAQPYKNDVRKIRVIPEQEVINLLEKYFGKKETSETNKTFTLNDLDSYADIGFQGLNDNQIIDKILNGKNQKYINLFNGDYSAYFNSQSQADISLCIKIAMFTDSPKQINRVFEKSKLLRPKWYRILSENTSYGLSVISRALLFAKELQGATNQKYDYKEYGK